MAKFNLEDYELVADALIRLYNQYPNARVITDNKTPEGEINRFIFLAEIYLDPTDPTPFATGWAEEIVGQGMVNATSALENCETSAIGRAISNSVLCLTKPTKQRPSREEMEKVERYKSEPRKEVKPKKVYTEAETLVAKALIANAKIALETEELKTIWTSNTQYLDIPVEGETLKGIINNRVKELQNQ